MIQILCQYKGSKSPRVFHQPEILVGRASVGRAPDLELGSDPTVSRNHARLWLHDGAWWIQDLDSAAGTFVNEVRLDQKRQLSDQDSIRVGETTLLLSGMGLNAAEFEGGTQGDAEAFEGDGNKAAKPPMAPPPSTGVGPRVRIEDSIVTDDSPALPIGSNDDALRSRLSLLLDLPLQLAAQTDLDALFQLIVRTLVQIIPDASRGVLLAREPGSETLTLKAHHPAGEPAVSMTLARRAVTTRAAFIWRLKDEEEDIEVSGSILRHSISTGMYAPMIWRQEVIGVVCVDNPDRTSTFSHDDLRLLLALSNYSAMAAAQQSASENLERHAEFTERLFRNRFPPRTREKLLQETASGAFVTGARSSQVTVLIADIRGFTNLTKELGPQRMGDLLNDYFPAFITAIHNHNGAIERFVGDAIFAVFGSPEPDDKQHEHAIRAAIAVRDAAEAVSHVGKLQGKPVCEIGIGIDCGEALNGFIGNAERMEFTVVGDPANFASRYCNGARPGEIVISKGLYSRVFNLIEGEPTHISTKHEGELDAFRLRGLK